MNYEDSVTAAVNAAYHFDQLSKAKTIREQSDAYLALSNAMSDLKSWLPGYRDFSMPWERLDEFFDPISKKKFANITRLKGDVLDQAWKHYWSHNGAYPAAEWWADYKENYK